MPMIRLGRLVAIIENVFDPETIVVGGRIPPHLANRLIAEAGPLLHSVSEVAERNRPRIMVSSLGPDVPLIGAGLVALYNILAPGADIWALNGAKKDSPDPILR